MAVSVTDLSGQDLRNRSFRGQDLGGAVLRGADLRGADFSGANLRGADLGESRAGMRKSWTVLVVLLSLLFSIAIGALTGASGRIVRALVESPAQLWRFLGVFICAELVVFAAAAVWRGLEYAVRTVLPVVLALAIAGGGIAVVTGQGSGIGALAVLAFVVLSTAIVALASLARSVAGAAGLTMFALVAISGALTGGLLGGGVPAAVIAILAMLLGRRALKEDAGPALLTDLTTRVACTGGTSFRGADLSGATFESADLRDTDFRGALLQGTKFDGAKLKLCRFDPPPPVGPFRPGARPLTHRRI